MTTTVAPSVDGRARPLSVTAVAVLIIGAAIEAGIGFCTFASHARNSPFEAFQVGASERSMIDLFGAQPSVREKPGFPFARYVQLGLGRIFQGRLPSTATSAHSSAQQRKTPVRLNVRLYKLPDDDLLSHGNPHYHRRGVVSRSCSGWEGVVPTRYGHQAMTCCHVDEVNGTNMGM